MTDNYSQKPQKNGTVDRCHGYRAMRESTTLKEMWIVRYADDFRIFCKILSLKAISKQKWFDVAQYSFITVSEGLLASKPKFSYKSWFRCHIERRGRLDKLLKAEAPLGMSI